jgi:hypothetical protein
MSEAAATRNSTEQLTHRVDDMAAGLARLALTSGLTACAA